MLRPTSTGGTPNCGNGENYLDLARCSSACGHELVEKFARERALASETGQPSICARNLQGLWISLPHQFKALPRQWPRSFRFAKDIVIIAAHVVDHARVGFGSQSAGPVDFKTSRVF